MPTHNQALIRMCALTRLSPAGLLVLLLIVVPGQLPGLAQDSDSLSGAAPIKATVKKVELSLEELRDIGLDLKHVLSACHHLYDEVMIQPVTIQTEPEIIDMGVVISIPVATTPAGPPAPPRKDRVDMLMSEIVPVITLLKKNADDFVSGSSQLVMPDQIQQELNPQLSQWVSFVNNVAAELTNLQALTPGPTYDNYAIARSVDNIEKNIKQLEEIRRSVYKVLRKAGKELDH